MFYVIGCDYSLSSMSQKRFICPNRCIDLITFEEKLFACCKDGIYELDSHNDSLGFEDAEEDLFAEAKRPCRVMPVSEEIDGLLKVKFKREAICFTIIDKILLSLHLRKGTQAYIEATCLETFQCCNPNVCLLHKNDQKEFGEAWMMTSNDNVVVVHCFGITYIGELDSVNDIKNLGLKMKKCSARNKLELYADNIVFRPKIVSEDIIERIIDEFKVTRSRYR